MTLRAQPMDTSGTSQKDKVLLKIRQASDLPAMADTVNIINKFKSSEDSSVTDLANILLKDYALTTKILKVVNSVHYMQAGQVTTISRAIFLMGIEPIKNIALTLLLFEQLQKHSSQTEIMDAIIQAFCSGVIAQKIVEDLNYVEGEEAFICALLHPLGKIIVAHTMPDKMPEIRKLAADRGISEELASGSVLGISYEEIGTTIATEWNYPQKIVQSMHSLSASEAAAEPQETQKLALIATLSTEMSNVLATNGEKEEKSGKLKQLMSSYEERIPSKSKNIDGLIQRSVKEFHELASVLNLDTKKSAFSEQLAQWSKTGETSASDAEVLSFKTDSLKTIDTLETSEDDENPDTIFSKGIQEINNSLLGTYSMNDIFRIAMETVYRGMKSSQVLRVLFLVRDIKRPQMDIRLGFGDTINEAKKWFSVPIGDYKDIFNLAISNDNDLIIRDADTSDIKKYIPAWYKNNMLAGGYILLFPVTINKRNIGLICIEGDKKGYPNITKGHLNYIRILRDQSILATKQSLRPDSKPPSGQK